MEKEWALISIARMSVVEKVVVRAASSSVKQPLFCSWVIGRFSLSTETDFLLVVSCSKHIISTRGFHATRGFNLQSTHVSESKTLRSPIG